MQNSRLAYHSAIDVVRSVDPEDIRPVDYQEFMDFVEYYEGIREFSSEHFNCLLASGLGLMSLDTKVCFFWGPSGPAFLATSFFSEVEGCHILGGFGWDSADKRLSRRDKAFIGKTTVRILMLEDTGVSEWKCWARADNQNVLTTWLYIQRHFAGELLVTFRHSPLVQHEGHEYIEISARRKVTADVY